MCVLGFDCYWAFCKFFNVFVKVYVLLRFSRCSIRTPLDVLKSPEIAQTYLKSNRVHVYLLAIVGVPHGNCVIEAAGDHELAVGAESQWDDLSRVALFQDSKLVYLVTATSWLHVCVGSHVSSIRYQFNMSDEHGCALTQLHGLRMCVGICV